MFLFTYTLDNFCSDQMVFKCIFTYTSDLRDNEYHIEKMSWSHVNKV